MSFTQLLSILFVGLLLLDVGVWLHCLHAPRGSAARRYRRQEGVGMLVVLLLMYGVYSCVEAWRLPLADAQIPGIVGLLIALPVQFVGFAVFWSGVGAFWSGVFR